MLVGVLVLLALGPLIIKKYRAAPGSPWTDIADPWAFSGIAVDVAVLAYFLAMGPPRIHQEQQIKIAGLIERFKQTLRVSHSSDCYMCHGVVRPLLSVELTNTSLDRSIRGIAVNVVSISPSNGVRLPITLREWPVMNPGEPPVHVPIVEWDLKTDTFLIRSNDATLRPVSLPARPCTIRLVAHATDTPATKVDVVVDNGEGDQRLLWRIARIEPVGLGVSTALCGAVPRRP